jgi:hypothetical protein
MAASTHLQKSAVTDVTSLREMATLAQILEAGELGGNSEGPPLLDLGDVTEAWSRFVHDVKDAHGWDLASAVDTAGMALMAGESQRSFLRGLVFGRAFADNGLPDDDAVTATVDALISRQRG